MAIRSFLAFPISGELKERLKQILVELQCAHADVKWVKPENIHLTLKFLGDVEDRDLQDISVLIREQCLSLGPITCSLCEIGAFPDLHRPTIIWGALDDPKNKIQSIVQLLEGELINRGIGRDDHPFKPHITLGRVRSSDNLKNLIQAIKEITFENRVKQSFERIILYKSTLTPQGPIYDVLNEFELGKS